MADGEADIQGGARQFGEHFMATATNCDYHRCGDSLLHSRLRNVLLTGLESKMLLRRVNLLSIVFSRESR